MGLGVGEWVWVGHMVLELVEELEVYKELVEELEEYKELVWADEWVLVGHKELVYELELEEGDGVHHYKSHQLHIQNNHLPHYNSLFGYVHLAKAHDIAQL